MGDTHTIPQSILFRVIGSDLVSTARAATLTRMAAEPYGWLELAPVGSDTSMSTAKGQINAK